jgi:hypothetical protein
VPGKRDRPEASAVIFWVGWRGVPLLLQVSKSGLRPSEKPFDKSGIRHTLMWDRLGGMATQTYLTDLTDAEWELLQSLLPDAVPRRGRHVATAYARSSTRFSTSCAPAVLGVSSPPDCRRGRPSTITLENGAGWELAL